MSVIKTTKGLISKTRHRLTVFLHDLLIVPLAWFSAFWLRFNLDAIPEDNLARAVDGLPILLVTQAVAYWYFGLYKGVWRFASIPDLMRILNAVIGGVILGVGLLFLLYRLDDVPRSVPAIYCILLVMFLTGPRFLYRWLKDRRVNLHTGKRVLIVGAGKAGEVLVRDLLRQSGRAYLPVAFVDNKKRWHGQEVHGVPVVDSCEAIPQVVDKYAIECVMLAVPSARSAQKRHLVELCEQSGVPFRTVPELDALMSGRVSIDQLREVSIEDLLGRDPVSLDWDGIRSGLTGKAILVTGGGGSIGSELCRQVARLEPATLLILDQSEFNLYSIEMELRAQFPLLKLHAYIGDVEDRVTVERLFSLHKPDMVFHAAAYKHVPLLEHQVREAVNNNVLGTQNVAEAADRHKCSEFVLISTDKAVNPTNVMGSTKRLAELFCQNLDARSTTRFITVRFGNVLGSAGSVVPLFRKQIEAGGPVTVTHPDMERYFMTIPEASQLIMQAAAIGDGGEIFVLDMNEPVKISYLAEQMIRLSGKVPGEDIEIKYIGLRPGEKLYEELFHDQEKLQTTGHEKILLAQHRKVDWELLSAAMVDFEQACNTFDDIRLMQQLQQLVPENRIGQ